MSTIILVVVTIGILLFSLKKDKVKTLTSLKRAKKMMGSMLSDIVGILLLIGLILALIPPETIQNYIGEGFDFITVSVSALFGAITLIPAFVAFPLVGSLKDHGGGLVPLTAFLTTLTMVGFVTLPLEIKTFGKKFAILRNGLSFVFAIGIAFVVGGVFA